MSGERDRDYAGEIEGQIRAAQALIESLEEEVASLRQDLEGASVALKAAQEEVAAREQALAEKEQDRAATEAEARNLSRAMTELQIQASNDQLELTNQHISELARLQDKTRDQLRDEVGVALSAENEAALKAEYRKFQRAAAKEQEARIQALEDAYGAAQEKLWERFEEFGGRRSAELETLHLEAEKRKRESESKLRAKLEDQLREGLQAAARNYEKELEDLRKTFADRELELQRKHQEALESQQAEFDSLIAEMEGRIQESDEQHRTKLHEVKAFAENREQELRKAHSTQLAEVKAEAERRVESLKAQREADNLALRERYEERLAEAAERSRLELWAAQEKLEGLKLERTAEAAAYRGRLEELETALRSEKPAAEHTGTLPPEASEAGDPGDEVPSEVQRELQDRVNELEKKLAESEHSRRTLIRDLEDSEDREPRPNGYPADETPGNPSDGVHPGESEAENRIQALEEQLRQAAESLRQLSEPEHRLRSGISAFNASEHVRHVASINKSFGLPEVHAGIEGDPPGKPVFTFVWEDLAWRRYVAEPAEDLQEPRVYLIGGNEREELDSIELKEPNARIDARGRLMLGVQAR
ncbi:MAG: hypothetical protein ACFB50_07630 [Rubrobacteraceae bacterium]